LITYYLSENKSEPSRVNLSSAVKFIDTFIVNDELDLLELRLNEHEDFTQYFIAIESNRTHKAKPKPHYVKENIHRFEKWKDKLILISMDDSKITLDGTLRERRARDAALNKAKEMLANNMISPESVVSVVCDVDEIFEISSLYKKLKDLDKHEFLRPQWQFFYYNLNCHNPKHVWPDRQRRTFFCKAKNLEKISHFDKNGVFPKIKAKNTGVVGWHMSNFGGEEYIRRKYKSVFEANRVRVVKDVETVIQNCEDVLGRKNYGWKKGEPFIYPRTLQGHGKTERPINFWKNLLLADSTSKKSPVRFAFYQNTLQERGTSVALYDYADGYDSILNYGTPLILYNKDFTPKSNEKIKTKFENRFGKANVVGISWDKSINDVLEARKITHLYYIKWGTPDGNLDKLTNKNIKTCIHCVFGAGKPHGDVYARISPTVAAKKGVYTPVVPHVVRKRPIHGENMRKELNIPEDSLVFARYGARDTFDLGYVKQAIAQLAVENPSIYFLFANTNRFGPRKKNIIFLNSLYEDEDKNKFIRTSDAMIHARRRGESFGLSIAEFSVMNKPIITSSKNYVDRFHLETLGDKGIYYQDQETFRSAILNFRKTNEDVRCYTDFEPEKVMKIFEQVFV
tara:strand:- start:6969 stop:8843 length:1875 start_codon:yes stop_codon:yes gene_type:complete